MKKLIYIETDEHLYLIRRLCCCIDIYIGVLDDGGILRYDKGHRDSHR